MDFAIKDWYFTGKKLGSGYYSNVYLVQNKNSCLLAAMKIVNTSAFNLKPTTREAIIHRSMNHSGIIKLYDSFEYTDKWIFVMELASGGSMYDYITNNDIPENIARNWFAQIVSAVEYCHSKNIIHRDLKLENILFTESNQIKICDFGLSNTVKDTDDPLSTYCGSKSYAAPELFKGKPYNGRPVDIWALGIILYSLLFGRFPWRSTESTGNLVAEITSGRFVIPLHPASPLLHSMLQVNPSLRVTAKNILRHPWVTDTREPIVNTLLHIKRSSSIQENIRENTLAYTAFNIKRKDAMTDTMTGTTSMTSFGSISSFEDTKGEPPVQLTPHTTQTPQILNIPQIPLHSVNRTPGKLSSKLSSSDPYRYSSGTIEPDTPRTAIKKRSLLRKLLRF